MLSHKINNILSHATRGKHWKQTNLNLNNNDNKQTNKQTNNVGHHYLSCHPVFEFHTINLFYINLSVLLPLKHQSFFFLF